ncbi:glutamate decarboxylase [Rhizoctonia solani AG-1 IB]|uniref:Glutamate decarboxylase n=1 Tax=Thanatephorus cucumeris (strain AG1-IB / isolate 7/3/14) TaxID=1108050 RepID=A0A0B7FVU3_THACB|nr:glutamate decarboxylase [Rhizoctonia solani AG-1 IB]
MSLSRHLDADTILAQAVDHPHRKHVHHSRSDKQRREIHDGAYSSRFATEQLPKFSIPSTGVSAHAAYQLVHDELDLDGTPSLNLASFVHTWMPEEGKKLIMENIAKNFADQDEYPATMAIHTRCVSMLSDLWKAPDSGKAIGTATGGSSEAIMLGGLALKKRWQAARKAAGKSIHEPGPNIVFGANAQVALEKFARYFDVECRLVPVDESTNHVMSPERAMEYIDENTIGVMVILGSTYTGAFEDVEGMARLLGEYETKTGHNVPIHVDAASGDLSLRSRTPNTSGHSIFHVSFPSIPLATSSVSSMQAWDGSSGAARYAYEMLPKELIFELHYLGSVEYSYTLNFSRSAAPIIGQFFNFLNLGFDGYRRIALSDLRNARLLSRALERSGYFTCVSNIHRKLGTTKGITQALAETITGFDEDDAEYYERGLPVVSFRFTDKFRQEYPNVKQVWIQNLLRAKQWIVPNYALPPNEQDIEILRIVVRESMSADLVEKVVVDILQITETLINGSGEGAMMATVTAPPVSKDKAGHSQLDDSHPDQQSTTTYAKTC